MKEVSKNIKKTINKTAETVKENPKTVLYVVGGLVAIYATYRVFKFIKTATSTSEIDNEVLGTGGSTTGATITDQEAINYAQQLLDAFNAKEPFYGTDEETVLSVFLKLKNSADFIKVYKAFGNKDYNGNNSPPEGFWSYLDSYEPRNLVYWLKSELSSSDGEVYDLVKETVENAGFTF